MSEWKKVRLGEIANYVNEKIDIKAFDTSLYISTDSMLKDKGGIGTPESIPESGKVTKYQHNDILVSNIRPYFKKIWFSNREGGCSNDVLVFRANDNIDSTFLYYVLSDDSFFDHMMSSANGTKMPRGNRKLIPSFEIPLPPLSTQHRIASILSRYDSLIENYQKQIKLLEEAAQRLYKEWFIDLRFPGHENTKIVEGLPEGWEKMKVGELIAKVPRSKQIPTKDYQKKGVIPIIDQSRDYIAGYTDDMESKVESNEPYIVFGDHTRVLKYVPFPFAKGADGTQLIMSNNLDLMPQCLLFTSLVSVDLSNYSYARHFKYLKEEEILVPTASIAHAFSKHVAKWYAKIQLNREQLRILTEARDRLLPKLMNGEIAV